MSLFAVICRDLPGKLQTRLDTRDKHLTFLKEQPGLRMAGPLIEEGEMRGSLLIVEAETLTQVKDWAAGGEPSDLPKIDPGLLRAQPDGRGGQRLYLRRCQFPLLSHGEKVARRAG